MATSRIFKGAIAVVLPIGLFCVVILGFATHGFNFGKPAAPLPGSGNGSTTDLEYVSRLSLYHIPDALSFCGEKMPLQIPDVRQRMEQTFYVELSDGQIILDLKRSTEYFPYIEQKLREMNLPMDLKYLPVAESALRNLVSYRGAAGIWQFTPSTARKYGLIVNRYVDERFNFRKATDAALRYLADLDSTFGSWTLAVAAYNMGQAGISASLQYQMVKSYYNLYLNDETAHFVFRIVALKQILSHYKSYGFELEPSDFYQPPETKSVVVTRIRNLALWARQQGANYKVLRYLNPWLINRYLPDGTWTIRLPKYVQPTQFAESSSAPADTVADSVLDEVPDNPVMYRVKRGDSLIKIADLYGVTVRELVDWNNLGDRRYLRIGQRLKIFLDNRDFDQ